MRRQHRIAAAFTLVELLVVSAVVALLVFPAVAAAKRSATSSGCQGNLRQIACGLALYTEEYDGLYPVCLSEYVWPLKAPVTTWEQRDAWERDVRERCPLCWRKLSRYVPHEVWRCPADSGAVFTWDGIVGPSQRTLYERFGHSYCSMPEETVWFGPHLNLSPPPVDPRRHAEAFPTAWDHVAAWHGRHNVLYSDGAVRRRTYAGLFFDLWAFSREYEAGELAD